MILPTNLEENSKNQKKPSRKRLVVLISLLVISFLIFLLVAACGQIYKIKNLVTRGESKIFRELGRDKGNKNSSKNKCNVGKVFLRGDIVTYSSENKRDEEVDSEFPSSVETASEDVCRKIDKIDKDDSKKAIIIEVDSGGGSPVAAEEIERCVGRAKKPVVAYIRELGASAAYWSITSADKIYASSISDVGSIGIIISYLDEVEKNEYEGLKYHVFSTGKYKDMLSPDRAITKEEEDLTMENLRKSHEIFVETIARDRNLDSEAVREMADGRVFTGSQALEKGLIDEIGGEFEVKRYLEENLLGGVEAETCSNEK